LSGALDTYTYINLFYIIPNVNTDAEVPTRILCDSIKAIKNVSGRLAAENFTRIPADLSLVKDVEVYLNCESLQGDLILEIEARGSFKGQCQRCLEELQFNKEISVTGQIPDNPRRQAEDDVVSIEDGELDVIKTIEDEFLLALPMVPLHDVTDCRYENSKGTQSDVNDQSRPFSVLKTFFDEFRSGNVLRMKKTDEWAKK